VMPNFSSAECRLCASSTLISILNLDGMPSKAQYFSQKKKDALSSLTNLDIRQCSDCGLAQIVGNPVDYYREVIRSNRVSSSMREFRLEQLSNFITSFHLQSKLILEVGCGRGDILEILRELNCNFYGMEFNKDYVKELTAEGYLVIPGYPDVAPINSTNLLFDAFLSFNVLEHAPHPKKFLLGLRAMLRPDAVGLIEVPNFNMIISKNMISEFMLEHLTYFTKATLQHTLESSGFEVLKMDQVWHDYLICAIVRQRSMLDFSQGIQRWKILKKQVREFLSAYKKNQICVWGAGHQSLATISILGLCEQIEFIVDSAQSKQGKYAPSSGIPIVSPQILKSTEEIACVIVLGGSYTNEIVSTLRESFSPKLIIITLSESQLKVM